MEHSFTPHGQSKRLKNWARTLANLGAGLGAAFALSLAACGSSKENKATASASPTQLAGSARPALWELSDKDTTIYLFGTVHMLKPGMEWFDGEVKAAFDRSDELVMEVVEPDPSKMNSIVTTLALNPNGPTITSRLTPEEKERYLKALADNGLPAATMDQLDPWMVAITLSVAPLQRLGYDQDIGVEKTLEQAARDAGKTVTGLETAEQQLGYFDALPEQAQLVYLNTTVAELPKVESEFDQLLRNWAEGKPDALAEQMNASLEATPGLAKLLLFDRNARWADWVARRLEQPGTVFLAVGAGHLAGKNSVLDMLNQRKLAAKRLVTTDLAGK